MGHGSVLEYNVQRKSTSKGYCREAKRISVARAVIIRDDGILRFEQYVTLLVGQHRAKGMITMFARAAGSIDSSMKKSQVNVVHVNLIDSQPQSLLAIQGIVCLKNAFSSRRRWLEK
jgi:hypothetical protein